MVRVVQLHIKAEAPRRHGGIIGAEQLSPLLEPVSLPFLAQKVDEFPLFSAKSG